MAEIKLYVLGVVVMVRCDILCYHGVLAFTLVLNVTAFVREIYFALTKSHRDLESATQTTLTNRGMTNR